MRLLVSVADPNEVRPALEGGADIIDAKDPSKGGMGVLGAPIASAIASAVDGRVPLSIALGDAPAEDLLVERLARAAALGANYAKMGFMGIDAPSRAERLASTAVATGSAIDGNLALILVAYADAAHVRAIERDAVLSIASTVGAQGVLLDTARKDAESVLSLVAERQLGEWIERAHDLGLLVALAGRLDAAGVATAARLGAEIAGVRGAACNGGREGRVRSERVAALSARCRTGVSVPSAVVPEPRAPALRDARQH